MGVSITDMLGPRVNDESFEFGFNNKNFSDRILHIEITPEESLLPELKKRKVSHDATHSNDSDCCVGVEIKTLHINSLILAAKSPFFYKLFQNGMMESQQTDITLRISSSEKTALMDLLNFMYSNTLSAATRSQVLDVLMVADKYEVGSCMTCCCELLLNMPMSLDIALSYLELPSTLLVVEPLIDASKKYLAAHYMDLSKWSEEEKMKMSCSAIEFILGSEGFKVDSEDDVYEFISKWGRAQYPNLMERREILTKRMSQLIRFPYMSCSKLKEVLSCGDFDNERVTKLVAEALSFKVEPPDDASKDETRFCRRSGYKYRGVKVVRFEYHRPRCVAYFTLKKEELRNMSLPERLHSEAFVVGGRWFSLVVHRNPSKRIGLSVVMRKGSETCRLLTRVEVMKRTTKMFDCVIQGERMNVVSGDNDKFAHSWPDLLLGNLWTDFMSDQSEYFLLGMLHLRVDITVIV